MRTLETSLARPLILLGTVFSIGCVSTPDRQNPPPTQEEGPPQTEAPEAPTPPAQPPVEPPSEPPTDPTAQEPTPTPPTVFSEACESNADCESGICVDSPDGKLCSEACSSECPEDWVCTETSAFERSEPGSSVTHVCMPRFLTLCAPCQSDADCADEQSGEISRCQQLGDEGSFCATECGSGCKEGYSCQDEHCVPDSGQCECSTYAIEAQASTTCTSIGALGECEGTRSCSEAGLSECVVEECALSLHSSLFGDGSAISTNDEFTMNQQLGLPRLQGQPSNPIFTLQHLQVEVH